MMDEELQYAISQYADGTLPADRVAALEQRLREDPAARKLLEEYRRIGDLMQVALPLPEMDWDRLSEQISAAIDPDVVPAVEDEAPASYRLWAWKPLAMAAAVLMCATVALVALQNRRPGQPQPPVQVAINPTPVTPAPTPTATQVQAPANPALAMARVQVFTGEKSSRSPVEVRIGPAPDRRIDLTDLYPEMASDYRSSITIAGDPSRMALNDEFGIVQ